MSSDHPGIVAGVSFAVEKLGGNITACSQTVIGGFFTFITIIDLPTAMAPQNLAAQVKKTDGLGNDCQVIAQIAHPQPKVLPQKDGDTFVITAFGKDRCGIVKEFSGYLAGHDINIIDLFGDLRGEDFVLVGQITIPTGINISSLRDDLEETGKELGFTVRLQHNNIFVATNQLRLAE
jgi:predicted amino acid-binding ACT domain protein